MTPPPELADLLVAHHDVLLGVLRGEAGWIARYETHDDLAQAVRLRVLEAGTLYAHRSDGEFAAWLRQVARNVLADRRDHWSARKRRAAGVLRITNSGVPATGAVTPPAAPDEPGPRTVAERRELLVLAARALDTLPDRDRRLLTWSAEGISLDDQAERLELTYAAAQRAAHRATERLRRAMDALRGR